MPEPNSFGSHGNGRAPGPILFSRPFCGASPKEGNQRNQRNGSIMKLTRRPAAAWAAGICAAGLLAAGAAATPAAVATTASDPSLLRVEQVPTQVLASSEELAGLGRVVDAHVAGDNLFVEVINLAVGRRGYWRPLDGSGDWSSWWGDRFLKGDLLASEHDVLLLDVGTTDVLAWSRDGGGYRTVPEGTVLGRGAQRVAYLAEGNWGLEPVTQQVTGGGQKLLQPGGGGDGTPPKIENGFAITDSSLYAVDDSEFLWFPLVQQWNATTGSTTPIDGDPCGAVPGASDPRVEDARGRFALASCTDGVVGLTADSAGVYDDVTLAVRMKRTDTPPQLGKGFALGISTVSGELLAAPYLGGTPGTLGRATAFDLDDTGTAVVFVDNVGDVRIARDLTSWSSIPATEIAVDEAPPETRSVWAAGVVPLAPGTARFTTFVGGIDYGTPPFLPSGVAEEELRYRVRQAGESQFGDWMPAPPDEVAEYPAPSRICWQGRITDRAGNASAWYDGDCKDTVGTTNQVVAHSVPAVVQADDDGKTTIEYRYLGASGETLIRSDVRYRWFVPGEAPPDWTVKQASADFEVVFRLQDVPTGHNVCFQARGYDDDDSVSEWMAERCTYTDGEAPQVTGTTYPRWIKPSQTRVVDGVRTAEPQFTWTAEDDFGIDGYSVQRSLTRSATGAEEPVWTSATSYTRPLTEAGQHCLRVRAKDLARRWSSWLGWQSDHWGSWSGWRCSTMPVSADKLDGQSFGPYLHRIWPGNGDLITTRGYSGVAIYAKVNTGPRYGSMKVYMGSRFLGTVNAHATETGSKWVWLSPGGTLDGKVRFVADPGDFVDLREFYISR
ncbi:hypothetical protein [Promicromonospora sp. NPDC050880]|uniref:hypothetical protein n=1 Tax=Promicromonospora sp. NPDC050880 TaxID=3364406 RepID=UPI0037BD2526